MRESFCITCEKKIFYTRFLAFLPHTATCIFIIFHIYNSSSIAYIHPVYGAGVQTHDLMIMSHLPLPLDHGSSLFVNIFKQSNVIIFQKAGQNGKGFTKKRRSDTENATMKLLDKSEVCHFNFTNII
jgi:hypothetical protein